MKGEQSKDGVFIGIDWSDDHHDYSLYDAQSGERQGGRFEHAPESVAQWVNGLHERFGGRDLFVCLEQSRGALIYALMSYGFVKLFPINPKTLAKYREAFSPSGAKDDPDDAKLLCELLSMHRDRLRQWQPDDEQTRTLAGLCQSRRQLVDIRTQIVQKSIATLKNYFPQALKWTGSDLSQLMAADFLIKWPTLKAVRAAQPHTVRSFYYAHNCRSENLIQERLEQIRAAKPLTTDPAIVQPLALTVQSLARLLRQLYQSIKQYDRQIAELFRQHPDAFLFASLPGAGCQLAPRLLVAFGTDRNRYSCAEEMQAFSGIAPVMERSGKQTWVHWRWQRPTFICQSFYEFAQKSISLCPWAQAYYQLQRSRGKASHAAIRALAFKWIRVIWRCWQDGKPYDEARYIAALQKHHSPIIPYLQPQGVAAS